MNYKFSYALEYLKMPTRPDLLFSWALRILLLTGFLSTVGAAPAQATSFHKEEMVCGACGKVSTQHILSGFYFPFPPDMELHNLYILLCAASTLKNALAAATLRLIFPNRPRTPPAPYLPARFTRPSPRLTLQNRPNSSCARLYLRKPRAIIWQPA